MKKFIYIFAIALASAATFTACTEEEVTPSTVMNGGGGASDPK